ncbi:putative glutamine amidotransferase [Chitinophaga sp. CF118]|uniref:gamma-glutamyl-gamma-aminobutyrate hydrolase family protein n=1 Tax=Chitinophaga sp. CF118 TaxID=1884367 RepID=UPI0008E7BEC0|nr:gamma-glutamyl-gamma-aminobutyrate hydrolase family protein [Chitinophaga sp. CF118]SFD01184.1 putative glutamine amidotransferase [Chitinophaga sp. CF118]
MFIGITVRADYIDARNEYIDCIDRQLYNFAKRTSLIPVLLVNDEEIVDGYLANIKFSCFILSGGNDLSKFSNNNDSIKRDLIDRKIIDYALANAIPVLGICRGAQVIADYFGSEIIYKRHVGDHLISTGNFIPGKKMIVNSYHNYCISKLGSNLIPLAYSEDETVEAFKYRGKKIFGIMWHPERAVSLNEVDNYILKALTK